MTKLLQARSDKKITDISAQEIDLIKNDIRAVVAEMKYLSYDQAKIKIINLRFGAAKNSILHLAAKFDCLEEVKTLIQLARRDKEIVDIKNAYAFTPMHFVAIDGDVHVAQLLIEAGASLNPQTSLEKRKWTPIHFAARFGNLKILTLLIGLGVDMETKTSFGLTPLIIAAEFGHLNIVDFLLKSGANKNAITSEENNLMNALHYAAVDGHLQIVEHLLKAGIQRDKQTSYGFSALDFAVRTNNLEITTLLLSWGVGDFDRALAIAKTSKSEKVIKIVEKYIVARDRIFEKKWLVGTAPKLNEAMKKFKHDNLSETIFSPIDGASFNAYGILSLKKAVGLVKKQIKNVRMFYSDNGFVGLVNEIARVQNLVSAK